MPSSDATTLRRRYAQEITQNLDASAARIREAFATVPREAFLPPPPWTAVSQGVATTTSDLADIYANNLIALDRSRGINNGEPSLHAAWLSAVDPRPGETVIHVGAGLGYYTAVLATLVGAEGRVEAYELEEDLAAMAGRNLEGYPHVALQARSALGQPLPEADIVYVNAGVLTPDVEWLKPLKPNGRLIFPWQPVQDWGPTLLVTNRGGAFAVQPLMNVGFIPCSGQGRPQVAEVTKVGLAATRSVWIRAQRPPDDSATLICEEVWFSTDAVA